MWTFDQNCTFIGSYKAIFDQKCYLGEGDRMCRIIGGQDTRNGTFLDADGHQNWQFIIRNWPKE